MFLIFWDFGGYGALVLVQVIVDLIELENFISELFFFVALLKCVRALKPEELIFLVLVVSVELSLIDGKAGIHFLEYHCTNVSDDLVFGVDLTCPIQLIQGQFIFTIF